MNTRKYISLGILSSGALIGIFSSYGYFAYYFAGEIPSEIEWIGTGLILSIILITVSDVIRVGEDQ